MGPPWAHAFGVALVVTLAATPVLRRLALATDFVDRPGNHKSHVGAIPYLGGVGLVVAVCLATLFAPRPASQVGVVVLGATLLGTVGLLDDHRTVHAAYRFLAEVGAAAAVVLSGMRVHATGVVAYDVAITMVWIVGVTNAVNFLDNMDGLAAGVAAAAAAAVFALAVLGEQATTAALAAGVVGACLGFLVYNRPPASIFMGDAGSLFLGFMLAVLTIDVNPSLDPPSSFLIPVTLLALPVLDTTTVTLARMRRGLAVSQGGQDHLSHRFVARGLSRARAVSVLVAAEVCVGAVAVAAGRHALSLVWALMATVLMLAAVVVCTARARVYARPILDMPRRLRRAVAGLAVAVPVVAAPAVFAVVGAESSVRAGARATTDALRALTAGDGPQAAAAFRRASSSLDVAARRLRGPLTSLGLGVPGVASNLRASRSLVSAGQQLASSGTTLAAVSDARVLPLAAAAVPLDGLRKLTGALDEASEKMRASKLQLGGTDRPYLLPGLSSAVHVLDARLTVAISDASSAARFSRLLPPVLGGDGARRYLVAVVDSTDLRATGGTVRSFGELLTEGGRLTLARVGRVQDLPAPADPLGPAPPSTDPRRATSGAAAAWRSANDSPDFPTSARRMQDLYARSGAATVDGVVAVDLPGLSALLALAGPVPVAGQPAPVTAANLLDVTTPQGVQRFPDMEQRARFLDDVAAATLTAFSRADLGDPLRLASSLRPAVLGGHLQLYLQRPDEERLATDAGADGALAPAGGDSLLVVHRALSPAGLDRYMHRSTSYQVQVDPTSSPAKVSGRVEVALRNDAPRATSASVPITEPGFANRTYVSIYSPFSSEAAALDGRPIDVETETAFDRRAYSAEVSVLPQETRTLQLDLSGRMRLGRGGWLSLDLPHQPSPGSDQVAVSLTVPDGWRIAEARGLRRISSRQAVTELRPGAAPTVWVRVERTGFDSLWSRLWDEP